MLSDVTISIGSQSVTFPGLYLLIGCLIVLGLIGFIVAMTSSRRIERKTSEATDILVVQLERIGDALDRLVTQNANRAVNERPANEPAPARQRDRFLAEWAIPGRGIPAAQRAAAENATAERPAQKPVEQPQTAATPPQQVPLAQEKRAEKPEEQPVESNLSEPARSILYSMLGR